METTWGIFLIDKESSKILICRFHQNETWSIPKGPCFSGESFFSTAIRDLYEETNISYGQLSIEHSLEYEIVKDDGSDMKAFVVYIDEEVGNFKMKCHKKVPGKKQPVVEECKWVLIDEACTKLNPCQVAILKSL